MTYYVKPSIGPINASSEDNSIAYNTNGYANDSKIIVLTLNI